MLPAAIPILDLNLHQNVTVVTHLPPVRSLPQTTSATWLAREATHNTVVQEET